MTRIFWILILLSASFSTKADHFQNSVTQDLEYLRALDIDSSFVWLEKHKQAAIEIFTPVAYETIARTYETGDPELKAKAHGAYAAWNSFIGYYPFDSTLYHNQKALQFYKEAGDREMTARIYNNISADYSRGEDYEASINSIMSAIEIYEELDDRVGVVTGYKNLGFQYGIYGQHEKAVEYSERAMKEFEQLEEHALFTYASVNILSSYNYLGMEEKALAVAAKCLEIVKSKVPEEVFVEMKTHANRHETYLKLKRYDEALADAERAYAIALREIGEDGARYYRLEIGNVLRLTGKCEEALPHLQAAYDRYQEMRRFNFKDPYEFLADCHEKLGNYDKALDLIKRVSSINEEFYEGSMKNLESELVIKYETGKKDQAIAERDSKLEQTKKVQYLTIGIAGTLGLLLLTLLYFFRKNGQTNQELAEKNKENELLLKEIHHRVKNNLQTISSLLNLQSESISDKNALNAVQESKNRVASMAMIHQKLYQGENLAAIEMKDYFKTIGSAIIDSFGKKAKQVSLDVEMGQIELDVDTAVPIGLITNELITNSLKYAFDEENGGKIKISLSKEKDELYKLEISDNGTGLTSEEENSSGFGTLLVQLLSTQLNGQLKKKSNNGTVVSLSFRDQEKSVA